LLNEKHAQREVDLLEGIWLAQGYFKKHDPTEVVKNHCVVVKRKAYIHEDNPFDLIFQRAKIFMKYLRELRPLETFFIS
jgi:hypothetical protein